MKAYTLNEMLLAGGFMALVVSGCGGGGGGSSSEPVVESTINETTATSVVERAASNGMCTKQSVSARAVFPKAANSPANERPVTAGKYEYDTQYPGSLGGSLNVHLKHDSGTTVYTYSMDGFRNNINGKDIALNGEAEKIDHGKPSDFGPVVSNTSAKTKGSVTVEVKDAGGELGHAEHYEFIMKGYDLVYHTEAMQPDKLTIDSIILTDTDSDKEYILRKVKADKLGDLFANLTAVYTDADVGTLKVSQESNVITLTRGSDSIGGISLVSSIVGSLEFEATDGTKGVLEVDGSSVKVYIKNTDGEKTLISELDCPFLTKENSE